MGAVLEEGVPFFRVKEAQSTFNTIDFCRPLTEGQIIKFSLGFNNKFEVTSEKGANMSSYVFFSEYNEPCLSRPPSGAISFELFAGGAAEIQLTYHNLFTVI